jgi:predicted dehydrogenase
MARQYRVAVIGRKGRHGHGLDVVWKALDNVEVVAVADEDEPARAGTARQLNARAAYGDYRAMLDKAKPQIVSVADRFVDTHRDVAVACARAGASIVLEKPMARTLAEADEIVRACETHHVKLALAHQTSYSPRVQRIRELLAAGRLGDLLEMRGRGIEDHRPAPHDLISHGTHVFDLMRLFHGEARWCLGRVLQDGKRIKPADVRPDKLENVGLIAGNKIDAVYGFDRGVVGTFGTFTNPGVGRTRFGLVLLGTRGVIQMTTGSLPPAYFLDDPSWFPGQSKKGWMEITSNGLGKPETITAPNNLGLGNVWLVQDLMAAIEQDRQPISNVYAGRAALEMIHGVYASERLNQPVNLPLANRQHPLANW